MGKKYAYIYTKQHQRSVFGPPNSLPAIQQVQVCIVALSLSIQGRTGILAHRCRERKNVNYSMLECKQEGVNKNLVNFIRVM